MVQYDYRYHNQRVSENMYKSTLLVIVILLLSGLSLALAQNPDNAPHIVWSVQGNSLLATATDGNTPSGNISFYVNNAYVGSYVIPALSMGNQIVVITFTLPSTLYQWSIVGSGFGVDSYQWVDTTYATPTNLPPPPSESLPIEVVSTPQPTQAPQWEPSLFDLTFASTKAKINHEAVLEVIHSIQ